MKILLGILIFVLHSNSDEKRYWMKIPAKDKFERSVLSNLGISIEIVEKDYVIAIGTESERNNIQKWGRIETQFEYKPELMDFPKEDSEYRNYNEAIQFLESLEKNSPEIVHLNTIGKSLEGRLIQSVRISIDKEENPEKPAILFLGTHHAREHLSTEMSLELLEYLVDQYNKNDEIKKLVESREIYIIPMVNPDGVEFDISSGSYKAWRKNRSSNGNSSYGVDLNRNYGFKWGTGGSSQSPTSDVYMGPKAFSEPETQAIKSFVENHNNITILTSFHSFSRLILYPWGHTYSSISNEQDLAVHEKMAQKMASWNGYTPQQSSDLYIASGDTTDWSYGEHRIISFTFELDPKFALGPSGFYPGPKQIPDTFQKNLKPCLYMIDLADNPYRVLESNKSRFGTSLIYSH